MYKRQEEYRRGTFAIGGPTDAVERVGGRAPEDIETIARRIVAQRREAQRSVGATSQAVWNFMRILATPKPDTDAIVHRKGHVLIDQPQMSQDNAEWRNSHGAPALQSNLSDVARSAA